MATILIISIILDISNQQYEFKVHENVYDCNLCNIKRRKYDFGNYTLNGILIKKRQIGGQFAKKKKINNNNKLRPLQDICGTKSIFVLILCTCNLYLWHVMCLKHFIMNNSSY